MSSEDKDSGIRGRIDRFFDKRAKEQQDLLSGKIGGVNISDSWSSTKEKLAKKSKSNKKIYLPFHLSQLIAVCWIMIFLYL